MCCSAVLLPGSGADCRSERQCSEVKSAICLCGCYVMSGTDLSYSAIARDGRGPNRRLMQVLYLPTRVPFDARYYSMPGTDRAHGATCLCVLYEGRY
eukprot:1236930-Rhodomonas_salina.3